LFVGDDSAVGSADEQGAAERGRAGSVHIAALQDESEQGLACQQHRRQQQDRTLCASPPHARQG
jgi:hypothetical protein